MLPLTALAALALFQGTAPQTPVPTPPPARVPTSASVVAAPRPAPDAVVATIDGKPVTAGQIENYLWAWKERDVVREFADYQIVADEAAKKGLTATDDEIRARIDAQLAGAKASLPAGQTIEGVLRERNVDPSRLALSARTAVLLDKIAAQDFKPANFVRIDALLFRNADGTPLAVAKATKDANAASASLAAGKPWDAVVKSSTAPLGTAQAIPPTWVPLDKLPDDLRAQVVPLKAQSATKPIPGPNGVQILHVVERGDAAPPADLDAARTQFVGNARSVVLQRLRATAKIEYK